VRNLFKNLHTRRRGVSTGGPKNEGQAAWNIIWSIISSGKERNRSVGMSRNEETWENGSL
jgi:hypothetical protein